MAVADGVHREDAEDERDAAELRQRITEVGVGITLVGVVFNIGLTIGLSLTSPLYVRLPLAVGVPLLFVVALGYLSRRIDLLSTIPWWLTKPGPDPWGRLTGDGDDESEA